MDQNNEPLKIRTYPIENCCSVLYHENEELRKQLQTLKKENDRLVAQIQQLTKQAAVKTTSNGVHRLVDNNNNDVMLATYRKSPKPNLGKLNGYYLSSPLPFEINDDSLSTDSFGSLASLANPAELLSMTLSEDNNVYKFDEQDKKQEYQQPPLPVLIKPAKNSSSNRRKQPYPRHLQQDTVANDDPYEFNNLSPDTVANSPMPRRRRSATPSTQAVKCPVCYQSFSFVTNYYRHCRIVHQIKGKTPRPIRIFPIGKSETQQ